jgi:hypothetical protein
MPGFPKSRPPANRIALERWIDQKAQADGLAANRLRRWPQQFEALASGMAFPITDVCAAAQAVTAFIDRIASAGAAP